jgi:hypothetical protein
MTRKIANRGLLAAVAASTLLAVVGALAFASIAAAAPAISLSLASSTAAPGSSVTVHVNASGSGTNSAYSITGAVSYDPAKLTPTACTPANTCNKTLSATTVGIAVLSTDALSGSVASVTFDVAAAASGTVNLGLTLTECTNEQGDSRTDCATQGTTLTIAVPTPSPSPAAATPSPTVAVFANTGGNPSDGSSSTLPLALAALGLVTVGGAAWAVARTRRIAG